jgi:hypothetical protein
MHNRSRHVLTRLRKPLNLQVATVATKPAVRSRVALIRIQSVIYSS